MFLSSIITGILSHHLSWVTPFLKKEQKEKEEEEKKFSNLISSIYGSNYYNFTDKSKCAKKFCRIILIGKNKEMMKYLSFILSYFIKSDQIFENIYFPHNETNHLSWFGPNNNLNQNSEKTISSNSPLTFSPKTVFSPISFQSKSYFSETFIEQEKLSKFREFEDQKEVDQDSPTDTEDTEDDSGSIVVGSMAQSFKIGSNYGSLMLGEESYIDKSSFLPNTILSKIKSTRDIGNNNNNSNVGGGGEISSILNPYEIPIALEGNSVHSKSSFVSSKTFSKQPKDRTSGDRKSPNFLIQKKSPDLQRGSSNQLKKRVNSTDFLSIMIDKDTSSITEEELKKMNFEMKEIPMIFSDLLFQKSYPKNNPNNFYLFTNICSIYCSSFVLMSIEKMNLEETFNEDVKNDLKLMLTYPYDGKSPDVSSCLIIDVDELSSQVLVCTKNSEVEEKIEPSNFVTVLIKEIIGLKDMGVTENELEKYLNDKLQDLFLKSKLLKILLEKSIESKSKIKIEDICKIMKIDIGDLFLLLSIISTYNGNLLTKVNWK